MSYLIPRLVSFQEFAMSIGGRAHFVIVVTLVTFAALNLQYYFVTIETPFKDQILHHLGKKIDQLESKLEAKSTDRG